jgi:hypothetical protein
MRAGDSGCSGGAFVVSVTVGGEGASFDLSTGGSASVASLFGFVSGLPFLSVPPPLELMLEEDVTIVLRGDVMVSITATHQRSSLFVSEKRLQYKKEGVNSRNKKIHMRTVPQRTSRSSGPILSLLTLLSGKG